MGGGEEGGEIQNSTLNSIFSGNNSANSTQAQSFTSTGGNVDSVTVAKFLDPFSHPQCQTHGSQEAGETYSPDHR